jgi:hypothetical protein
MDNQLTDKSGDRKYYAMIPHLIYELGLSAKAIVLYCYIKRVVGECGECWQSTRTIAKKLKMSMGSVSKAKNELAAIKYPVQLIDIQEVKSSRGKPSHHITILDIWQFNEEYFGGAKTPEMANLTYELHQKNK